MATTVAPHYDIMQAVAAQIIALNLADIGSRVYTQMLPDEKIAEFPAVFVTCEGVKETIETVVNIADDWGFPTHIWIADRNDSDYQARLAKYLLWRFLTIQSFNRKRLVTTSSGTSFDCLLEPDPIFDPKLPAYQYVVTGFTLRFKLRLQRT